MLTGKETLNHANSSNVFSVLLSKTYIHVFLYYRTV